MTNNTNNFKKTLKKLNQGHMVSQHMPRMTEISVPRSLYKPLIRTKQLRGENERAGICGKKQTKATKWAENREKKRDR